MQPPIAATAFKSSTVVRSSTNTRQATTKGNRKPSWTPVPQRRQAVANSDVGPNKRRTKSQRSEGFQRTGLNMIPTYRPNWMQFHVDDHTQAVRSQRRLHPDDRTGKKAGISTARTARFSSSMASTPTAKSTPKRRGKTMANQATSSDGVISSCPTISEIPTGTGATAARHLHRQDTGPGVLVRRGAGSRPSESSPFMLWTAANTSISARCVPPTNLVHRASIRADR